MGIRVYLVEDSELLRSQIRRVLEETGKFEIAGSAGSPATALKEIQNLSPDLILLDLQLDGGWGLEILDTAGIDPSRFVILTNHGDEPFRTAAAARGITQFYDKSTEFDLFLTRMSQLASLSAGSDTALPPV